MWGWGRAQRPTRPPTVRLVSRSLLSHRHRALCCRVNKQNKNTFARNTTANLSASRKHEAAKFACPQPMAKQKKKKKKKERGGRGVCDSLSKAQAKNISRRRFGAKV
jgi:hypothetical protein